MPSPLLSVVSLFPKVSPISFEVELVISVSGILSVASCISADRLESAVLPLPVLPLPLFLEEVDLFPPSLVRLPITPDRELEAPFDLDGALPTLEDAFPLLDPVEVFWLAIPLEAVLFPLLRLEALFLLAALPLDGMDDAPFAAVDDFPLDAAIELLLDGEDPLDAAPLDVDDFEAVLPFDEEKLPLEDDFLAAVFDAVPRFEDDEPPLFTLLPVLPLLVLVAEFLFADALFFEAVFVERLLPLEGVPPFFDICVLDPAPVFEPLRLFPEPLRLEVELPLEELPFEADFELALLAPRFEVELPLPLVLLLLTRPPELLVAVLKEPLLLALLFEEAPLLELAPLEEEPFDDAPLEEEPLEEAPRDVLFDADLEDVLVGEFWLLPLRPLDEDLLRFSVLFDALLEELPPALLDADFFAAAFLVAFAMCNGF